MLGGAWGDPEPERSVQWAVCLLGQMCAVGRLLGQMLASSLVFALICSELLLSCQVRIPLLFSRSVSLCLDENSLGSCTF